MASGRSVIQYMARSLADQTSFPDLENWEGSAEKIGAAQAAVKALKEYLSRKDNEREIERQARSWLPEAGSGPETGAGPDVLRHDAPARQGSDNHSSGVLNDSPSSSSRTLRRFRASIV